MERRRKNVGSLEKQKVLCYNSKDLNLNNNLNELGKSLSLEPPGRKTAWLTR